MKRKLIRKLSGLGQRLATTTALLILCLTVQAKGEQANPPQYLGSESCNSCHGDAVKDWQSSHHALAWAAPTIETVVGGFDGRTFTHQGNTTRFLKETGQYIIETEDAKGGKQRFAVAGVVGIEPLQQYIVETAEIYYFWQKLFTST